MAYKSIRQQTLHYFARPHEGMRREPLEIPAAWRGSTMRRRDDWITELGPAEQAELDAAVKHALSTGRPLHELTAADFPLPGLSARIGQWRREVRHGRGFHLIRGVPVASWSARAAEAFFWCFGLHLGIPGAQNAEGDLLGHVRDEHHGEDVRYYRTNRDIGFHCDAADVVGLLCLRPARRGGLSRVASSLAIYNEILRREPALAQRLYRPFYLDTHGDGGLPAYPVEPCRFAGGELRVFWHSPYFRSAPRHPQVPELTDRDRATLDLFDELAGSSAFHLDMDLRPGDVQLLSNHTQVHARTAYEDSPDPHRQRHLLRLWISLPESGSVRMRWLTGRARARLLRTLAAESARRNAGV